MGLFMMEAGAGKVFGPRTSNGKAFQYFRQGRLLIDRHLKGDPRAALENFDRAIELDPNYSDAYAGRADARMAIFWATPGSHDDISLARVAINKAIELDEKNAYAHTISCRLKGTYDWDFGGAEKECRRAFELDPNDHESRVELGFLLNSIGRSDEALAEMDKAVSLAPTSFNKRSRGVILYFSRRYDEAIEQLRRVDETEPEYSGAAQYLMKAYEMKGDFANAFEYYVRVRERKAEQGEMDRIRAVFSDGGWPAVLQNMTDTATKNPFHYAGTLAQLGRFDEAIQMLNEAADRRRV